MDRKIRKVRRYNSDHRNETNQGFRIPDQWYLKNYDNPTKEPQIQLFTEYLEEEDEPEERICFCAVYKSKLYYHKYLQIWICGECQEQYLRDVPIRDPNEVKTIR